MTPVDRFLCLSEALTGFAPLDRALAEEYLGRIEAAPEGANLPDLLDEFDAIVAAEGGAGAAITARIMNVPRFQQTAQVVILLWYLGEIRGQRPAGGRPEHYFSGLFWDVISAHPPGLSGGYFGHWTYPPDN
ncbi:sugar dehydrogenase complex small subunit [Aquisphaera insulae]|uniref:sugar dehydrogenase complex small subunit n=1 Tax=Aquisphaera insulae TaxID=2712864 RepID=UPI0013ECDC47|nr:hypothetical protein [Aquisphaera insulae]